MYLPGPNRKIPLVFEFGGFTTRSGYGGEDTPKIIIPSVSLIVFTKTIFFKDLALMDNPQNPLSLMDFGMLYPPPAASKIISPSLNEMANDIDAIEFMLKEISTKKLFTDLQNHHVFLVEPPIHNRDFRLKVVEMLFEKFKTPGVFMHKASVLSSYVFAKENLILLDSGAYHTYCVPIQDGYANNKAIIKCDIGGETLTEIIHEILSRRNPFNSRFKNRDKINKDIDEWGRKEISRMIKEEYCKLLETKIDKINFNEAVDKTVYELPDKTLMEISKEIFTVPELLFSPDTKPGFKGLHKMIEQSVEKIEIETRKELLSNIIVVGGNCLLHNFIERLQKELFQCELGGLANKVKVFTSTGFMDIQHSSWVGGSIISSMSTFEQLIMTQEDYEEHGAILIERKCFS